MNSIDWDKLGFDAYKTKAIVFAKYSEGSWSAVEEDEAFTFTLDGFAQVLHYSVSCFEGMKAFRQKDGKAVMFRPDENAARLKRTADYLGIPAPSEEMFISMCAECVRSNIEFLPPYGHGASLYIRPLLMGTHPQMQLAPYPEAVFAVMCAPAGAYYGANLKSFSAVIPGDFDRAAPLGSGSYKVGANYAATFRPYKIAHEQGYQELLFLDSKTRTLIDEYGSSNFFAIKGDTYVTPLSDSVLPSITNKTLQQVAVDLGMKVEKRRVPVEELAGFDEVGACGTAVVVTPIWKVDVKPALAAEEVAKTYVVGTEGKVGPVTTTLYKQITGIQNGDLPDTHGWCWEIEGV